MPAKALHRLVHTHSATLVLLLFIVLPTVMLGVSGLILLQHEQDRIETQAYSSQEVVAQQIAEDLRAGMDAVQEEVEALLQGLQETSEARDLQQLMHEHPLVRFGFVVTPAGEVSFPPAHLNMDAASKAFLMRHESLINGDIPWFLPKADQPQAVQEKQRSGKYQVLKDFRNRSPRQQKAEAWSSAPLPERSIRWRPWYWQEGATLLCYYQSAETKNIVGIEVEMAAVFSRLQVLLNSTNLEATGKIAVLRDMQGRSLLVTREPPPEAPWVEVPMGPRLPFAHVGLYGGADASSFDGRTYRFIATALTLLLLLSILAASLTLGKWLRRSRQEAQQRVNFVSNVSHEFKTPLTTIRLYTDLLLEGRIQSEEKRDHYLRTMQNESERLARLVHNVLSFSRLEQGRKTSNPESLILTEELHRILEGQRERLTNAGMTLELPEPGCQCTASFDRDAFEQIALNLTDNAIKYAADGLVLRIEVTETPSTCEIRFIDRGPGIPRRQRKRIFRPFQQVDERLTRKESGTGLGLTISVQLAEDAGGSLRVDDTLGGGATFLWTLPKGRRS